MPTAENADKIIRAQKRAGVNFVASLPDASLVSLVQGFDKDNDIIHIPLSREEEGVGVCTGANLASASFPRSGGAGPRNKAMPPRRVVTLPLGSDANASCFWIILLLVWHTVEHAMR